MKIAEYLNINPMGSPYLKYAFNVYSQNGEDGIINKILEELEISEGYLVEFGAWDGVYLSNIYNLWKDGNFNVILIEGDSSRVNEFRKNSEKVSMHNYYVSPYEDNENSIENILDKISTIDQKENNLVLMSIDIDSCDYYVMRSLKKYKPIVIVIETDISFPIGSNFISYEKGCSFDSIWDLGKNMGYSVVAYTSNAILVRSDYLHKLKEFDKSSKIEDIYIDNIQYLTLAKLNSDGEILNEYFHCSDEYKNKIGK